jgi:hypothetical protein
LLPKKTPPNQTQFAHVAGTGVYPQAYWTAFVTRPISATLLAIAVLALLGPRLWAMARSR